MSRPLDDLTLRLAEDVLRSFLEGEEPGNWSRAEVEYALADIGDAMLPAKPKRQALLGCRRAADPERREAELKEWRQAIDAYHAGQRERVERQLQAFVFGEGGGTFHTHDRAWTREQLRRASRPRRELQ